MANIVFELLGNVADLTNIITDVALGDPLSALLVLSGTILWIISFGLFGYLTVGAILSGIIPKGTGRTPPQQGE